MAYKLLMVSIHTFAFKSLLFLNITRPCCEYFLVVIFFSSLCRGVCGGTSDPSHEPVLAPNVLQVCQLPQGAGRHRLREEPGKVRWSRHGVLCV